MDIVMPAKIIRRSIEGALVSEYTSEPKK